MCSAVHTETKSHCKTFSQWGISWLQSYFKFCSRDKWMSPNGNTFLTWSLIYTLFPKWSKVTLQKEAQWGQSSIWRTVCKAPIWDCKIHHRFYVILSAAKKKGGGWVTCSCLWHAGTPSVKPFRQLTYSYIKILWVQFSLLMFQKYHPQLNTIDFCINFCIFPQTLMTKPHCNF